jgi:hypothetical protein
VRLAAERLHHADPPIDSWKIDEVAHAHLGSRRVLADAPADHRDEQRQRGEHREAQERETPAREDHDAQIHEDEEHVAGRGPIERGHSLAHDVHVVRRAREQITGAPLREPTHRQSLQVLEEVVPQILQHPLFQGDGRGREQKGEDTLHCEGHHEKQTDLWVRRGSPE